MAAVTKNRTYGKIAGFWVITQKPMVSEIFDFHCGATMILQDRTE
jgi:hypothetical protein